MHFKTDKKEIKMATPLTHKIKEDYGTLSRFCKIHGINRNTFQVVVSGYATSAPLAKLLIKEGYIKSADELKKVSA